MDRRAPGRGSAPTRASEWSGQESRSAAAVSWEWPPAMLSRAPQAVHASRRPLLAHRHPARTPGQPLETECDARTLFVFLLLEGTGLGREQFGKREIRLTD